MPTLTSWLASQRKQGSRHVETDDAVWEAESSAIGLDLHAIDASLAVAVKEYGAGSNPRPRNFLIRSLGGAACQKPPALPYLSLKLSTKSFHNDA